MGQYGLSAKDLQFLKTSFFSPTVKYNQKEDLEIWKYGSRITIQQRMVRKEKDIIQISWLKYYWFWKY